MARAAQDLTPPELAVEVSGFLRAAGIAHAVGGALALGFYAEPRETLDVDLNGFVYADEPKDIVDAERIAATMEEDEGASGNHAAEALANDVGVALGGFTRRIDKIR